MRDRRLQDFKFRRQATIGPYVVDFFYAEARLVVELDGGQRCEEADFKRTAFLHADGYRVLRFWNSDVTESFEGVLERILEALQA